MTELSLQMVPMRAEQQNSDLKNHEHLLVSAEEKSEVERVKERVGSHSLHEGGQDRSQ